MGRVFFMFRIYFFEFSVLIKSDLYEIFPENIKKWVKWLYGFKEYSYYAQNGGNRPSVRSNGSTLTSCLFYEQESSVIYEWCCNY